MNCRSALFIATLMLALASLSCMSGGSELREPAYYEDDFFEVDERDDAPPPFTLSEGQPGLDAAEARPPRAQTTDLAPAQLQNLLERLPPIQAVDSDIDQARLPQESLPPPRPGQEIALTFPPQQDASQPGPDSDATLEVLRFSPQGDVPLAPQMSVTFNQPMVALASHQELGQQDPPAVITPAVPGHWRWVGTRTLFFEAAPDGADRMPMATEYTVEIPAGTKSVAGAALAESVTWRFRTPPPTLQTGHPTGGPLPLDPVLFAQFDQRIDPDEIIELAQVTARGQSYAVRLANEEEVASDNRTKRLIAAAHPDRWLAFVAEKPLPADTTVTVTFPPGTPSEEGPLVTAHPQSFSFQTLPPFALRRTGCGYDGDCPPGATWFLQFNNPIDAAAFDPTLFTIEPEPPGRLLRSVWQSHRDSGRRARPCDVQSNRSRRPFRQLRSVAQRRPERSVQRRSCAGHSDDEQRWSHSHSGSLRQAGFPHLHCKPQNCQHARISRLTGALRTLLAMEQRLLARPP